MGFFSKKASVSNENDTHEMVDAKIHLMQHDLDEVAKAGKIEITPSLEKPIEHSLKEAPHSAQKNLPTDSPFSKPTYSASNELFLEKEVHETSQPDPPQDIPSKATRIQAPPKNPLTASTAPLNLPTFEAVPTPIPHQPPNLEIPKSESSLSKSEPTPTKPQPTRQLERNIESIRTGAWPVEPSTSTKNQSDKKLPSSQETPKKVSVRKAITDKNALPENIILKEGWGRKKFVAIFIVIVFASGGGYYFWKTRYQERMVPEISSSNIPGTSNRLATDAIRVEAEKKLPFSTVNANPFLVDIETESVSTLREKLIKNATAMKEAGMTGPVPFSVVDKTNTPIAFFIFASVFNLGLSGDLLNSLDNDFTLSIVLDNGLPRLTLAINVKNPSDARKFLSASEKTLLISLKNIFLIDPTPSVSDPVFSSTTYRDTAIRYFNFPLESSLSLDYAFIESVVVIGTSKSSARAEIDAILDAKK